MYSGTHLAQETKDIVLDRARRGLMMNQEYLKLAKNDDTVARQYRHPMQDEQVRDALRWAKEEESHAKIGVSNAEERKAMEMESAERGLKDAQEKLADLQMDRGLLEVVAPADGVMTRIDLEPRDNVAARQTICEVLDPGDLVAKFNLQPEDLRIVAPADGEGMKQLTLRLPDFPEVTFTGTIIEMAEMVSSGGGSGGEANTIPITVKIEGATNPLVRLGLKCKASAQRTIKNVLLVPREAVKWEGGAASVQALKSDGTTERRTVTVGPSNDKMTMIVEGLSSGAQIVIDDKK
jgi:RND family efflux transporter MFP subunit